MRLSVKKAAGTWSKTPTSTGNPGERSGGTCFSLHRQPIQTKAPPPDLSSQPERTRISYFAKLTRSMYAAFFKESRMKFADATNPNSLRATLNLYFQSVSGLRKSRQLGRASLRFGMTSLRGRFSFTDVKRDGPGKYSPGPIIATGSGPNFTSGISRERRGIVSIAFAPNPPGSLAIDILQLFTRVW